MNLTVLQEENERLKALLAQTQAALAEHQAALAASEEARRRLESVVSQLNHEKFGAKSEKLHPDQYHLPLEDVEIANRPARNISCSLWSKRASTYRRVIKRAVSGLAATPTALI